jgi:hypothetical protein
MFGQAIPVDWDDPSLRYVKQTVLKKYCSLIHGQPVLEAVQDLKRRNNLSAVDVELVRCDIFQTGFDIAGGGGFGPNSALRTSRGRSARTRSTSRPICRSCRPASSTSACCATATGRILRHGSSDTGTLARVELAVVPEHVGMNILQPRHLWSSCSDRHNVFV